MKVNTTVVPQMAGLISMEIGQHGASHVSVIGDSAGGTLALAAVEHMVANHETVPSSMVLLSPWLDVGLTNPNIAFVQDPLLAVGPGQLIAKAGAGNLPENSPLVTPLYGSLHGLPPTYVYSGSLDSLAPGVLVLQQEAAAQGAPISFVLANAKFTTGSRSLRTVSNTGRSSTRNLVSSRGLIASQAIRASILFGAPVNPNCSARHQPC